MRTIPLTKGLFALVDDDDYESLSSFRWSAVKRPSGMIAVRWIYISHTENKAVYMHREVARPPQGMVVDHINHDGLDNRKENLRVCLNKDNVKNSRLFSKNKTGFKGVVHYPGRLNPFVAQAGRNKVTKYIGSFRTAKEAAEAYDRVAVERFREFACTNKMLGLL